MVVDVTKLACKVLNMLASEMYAELYDVSCEYDDWRPYAAYLWIARSGCDLPFAVQCQLDKIYEGLDVTIPTQTSDLSCGVIINEVPEGAACTTGILIRTIQ